MAAVVAVGFFAARRRGSDSAPPTARRLRRCSTTTPRSSPTSPSSASRGRKFTHDFFVPGTLITFPSVAVTDVAKIPGVTSRRRALSLQALHESGTVPKITDTVKTGGQTISTHGQAADAHRRAQTADRADAASRALHAAKNFDSTSTAGQRPYGTGTPSGAVPDDGRAWRNRWRAAPLGAVPASSVASRTNPRLEKCLTPAQTGLLSKVVVPEQTITRVLNPPTTNTATSTYTVAGVDPSSTTHRSHHQGPARLGHLVHQQARRRGPRQHRLRQHEEAEGRRDGHHQREDLTRSSAGVARRSPATSRTSTSPSRRCRASPRAPVTSTRCSSR